METVIKNSVVWRRRSTLERCLSVLIYITVIGLRAEAASADDAVCDSNECKETASAILAKMKTDVNPCDNFYEFACGNYVDKTQIPEDKDKVDIFSSIWDKVQHQLKGILTEETPNTEPKHLRYPKDLYKACTNTELIEKLGTKPMQQISNRLGGWPVVVGDSWDADKKWSWQETLKKLRQSGFDVDYIVRFAVEKDLKNVGKHIIELDQPTLGLDQPVLIKGAGDDTVKAYYNYMVNVAVAFGAKKEAAEKEMKEALQFEIDLAKISKGLERYLNLEGLYNLRSIKELQEAYPYAQWLDLVKGFLPDGINVDENEALNLIAPSYFEGLGKLLQNTDKRVIANYLIWRIHEISINFLNSQLRKLKQQYTAVLTGAVKEEERWKECVNIASGGNLFKFDENSLKIALGALYVRKYFSPESKAIISEIVKSIRSGYNEEIDELLWMDDKTNQYAKKKLDAINVIVGYPDEILDNKKLEKYYGNLEIDSDKYFESFLNLKAHDIDTKNSKLKSPVKKRHWLTFANPLLANALYLGGENSLLLPAVIFQDNFPNDKRPKFANYGSIGFFISQVMSSALRNEFDIDGNLKKWWQPETEKSFSEKKKCLIEKYSNYTDKQTGLKINSEQTQRANIADNAGVKAAYLAYRQWLEKNGGDSKLPGLNYTPQQLYWVSYAQVWCAKYKTEYLKKMIETEAYLPGEFRVLGPVSERRRFNSDYQCPEGAAMNTKQKCRLW